MSQYLYFSYNCLAFYYLINGMEIILITRRKRTYTMLFQIEYHRVLNIVKGVVFYNKMMSI